MFAQVEMCFKEAEPICNSTSCPHVHIFSLCICFVIWSMCMSSHFKRMSYNAKWLMHQISFFCFVKVMFHLIYSLNPIYLRFSLCSKYIYYDLAIFSWFLKSSIVRQVSCLVLAYFMFKIISLCYGFTWLYICFI